MGLAANTNDFFAPYYSGPQAGPANPNLPGFSGIPRIPGESDAAYQARLTIAQQPYQQAAAENKQIQDLAGTEAENSQKTLDTQTAMQKSRLNDLATLLAGQNNAQFNRDIPGIANTAQGQGFLETSGFGNALARDYTGLQAQTSEQLAQQALADRQLGINGIGDINTNKNNMLTSGLQRQFSVTDQSKANDLAQLIAAQTKPGMPMQPSTTDKLISSAGPIMSGIGALKTAGA